MKILTLDTATQFGWAVHNGVEITDFGTWDCSSKAGELVGARLMRAHTAIDAAMHKHKPGLVVHERVMRHISADSAHLYGALVGVVQIVCYAHGMNSVPIHWASIKKHATGKGNANKAKMLAAAQENWPNLRITDDNQADAMWMADLAHKEYRP